MHPHNAGDPRDLPSPQTVWALAGALSALEAGGPEPEVVTPEGPALYSDDYGTDDWRLAWCGPERAVLIGCHNKFSSAIDPGKRPVDLFAEAPGWLPWEWIADLEERCNIGYVYWWDGTSWARGPYPDDWEGDGVWLWPYSSLVAAVDEVGERIWDGQPPDDEGPEWRVPVRLLMKRALEGTIDSDVLRAVYRIRAFLDEDEPSAPGMPSAWNAAAALARAEQFGLTADSERPCLPEGTGRPERPEIPVISEKEWALLVNHAMRRASELERPPVPESGELHRLVEWIRAHALDSAGAAVLVESYYHLRQLTMASGQAYIDRDGQLLALTKALRAAETDTRGCRWLYLRLTVTNDDFSVERAFDHWPDWAPAQSGLGDLHGLARIRAEFSERVSERLPAWAPLLDPRAAEQPPPPVLDERPSMPVATVTEEGREGLIREIHDLLPGGVAEAVLDARCLVGYERVRLILTGADGRQWTTPDRRLDALVRRLREGMYRPGAGTWFGFRLVRTAERFHYTFEFEREPEFDMPPLDFSYALDQAYFPRTEEHVPDWLADRLAGARSQDRTPGSN